MHRSIGCFAALAALALVGCNAAPVAPEAVPARPSLTGYTYGSGNAVGTPPSSSTGEATTAGDNGGMAGSGGYTAPPTVGQMATESDTTSRGGYTYGSGN